jgi:adenylate cyclase
MTRQSAARLGFFLRLLALAVVLSAGYGYGASRAYGGDPVHGIARGLVTGLSITGALGAIELYLLRDALREPVRRLPFALHALLRLSIYAAVIAGGLTLGQWAVPERISVFQPQAIIFCILLSVAFNIVAGINRLIGFRVMRQFVSGRYRRPRVEERVLLFVDLESSTHIAERLGEVRFLDFLNRFVADVTDAIVDEGGEIHKYVGDEVIAAWPADDTGGARAVRACFAAMATLARRARLYEQEFGQRANFRAGLHAGPVVLGELGYSRMEIAFLGDTMNTAARIHELCRETGNRVIASDALLARVRALPPGVEKHALGPVVLRGKERTLELYALAAR